MFYEPTVAKNGPSTKNGSGLFMLIHHCYGEFLIKFSCLFHGLRAQVGTIAENILWLGLWIWVVGSYLGGLGT